jgi:hypothetical protein
MSLLMLSAGYAVIALVIALMPDAVFDWLFITSRRQLSRRQLPRR